MNLKTHIETALLKSLITQSASLHQPIGLSNQLASDRSFRDLDHAASTQLLWTIVVFFWYLLCILKDRFCFFFVSKQTLLNTKTSPCIAGWFCFAYLHCCKVQKNKGDHTKWMMIAFHQTFNRSEESKNSATHPVIENCTFIVHH